MDQDTVVVCYEKLVHPMETLHEEPPETGEGYDTDLPRSQVDRHTRVEVDSHQMYHRDKHRTPLDGRGLKEARAALIPLFNKYDGLKVFVSIYDDELGQGESASLDYDDQKIVTTARHPSEYLEFDEIITEAHMQNAKLEEKVNKMTGKRNRLDRSGPKMYKRDVSKVERLDSDCGQEELEHYKGIIMRYNRKLHCLNRAIERHLPARKLEELPSKRFERLCIMIGNAVGMTVEQFGEAFADILDPESKHSDASTNDLPPDLRGIFGSEFEATFRNSVARLRQRQPL